MFQLPKITRTLAPLLTALLLAGTGCMDELDELDAELLADTALDDEELALLLDEVELDAELIAEGDHHDEPIDEIAPPPPGPCDPPPPPLDLRAPEFGDPEDEGDAVKPPPIWVDAPELDPDCDEDEDGCEDGEGLTPAPFGIAVPELDPNDDDDDDEERPAPAELDNPAEVDFDNGYELW